MRKNKTKGRRYFTQTIIEGKKKKDGSLNPRAGKTKTITHQLTANR